MVLSFISSYFVEMNQMGVVGDGSSGSGGR